MADTFVYGVLPPGRIRLLKMLDAGISSSRVIPRFQLLTTRIEVADYIAMSYVWGRQAATRSIMIDGRSFNVRQSLYMALSSLRKCTVGHTIIWVDAICINQADNNERNEQVKMMDKIFSSANHVIAWLGSPQVMHIFVWREQDAETVETEDWTAQDHVWEISQRSYWTRMWIVQELSLAKEITFMVGDHLFDLFTLQSAVENKPAAIELRTMLSHLRARDPVYSNLARPLYELLLDYKDCNSTDPRDKVFALLSLVPDEERKALETVFPDYSLSYDAVVVLTLSFIRNWQREADLEAVLDALMVSTVPSIRRRLSAVSKVINIPQDADRVRSRSWIDVPYEGWDHSFAENSPKNQLKRPVLCSIYSLITAPFTWLFTSRTKTNSERILEDYQRLMNEAIRRG